MVSTSSTLGREPLVTESRQVRSGPRGRISRVRSVMPAKQALKRYHYNQIFQQSFPTVPTNLFSSGGAKATCRLEGSQFTRLKSFALTFTISFDSAIKLRPASHWLERISIFTSGGSKHAQTITSEGIEAFYNVFEHEQLKRVLEMQASTAQWTTEYETAGAGTLSVVIPLHTFMDQQFFDLDEQGDVLIHLYPATSINTSAASTVVPVVTQAGCIIQTDTISQQDREQSIALYKTSIVSRVFCDPVAIDYHAQSLGPGQRHQFSLENLSGKCAGLFLYVKQTSQPYTVLFPGSDALIDVKSVSNVSKWGAGQPVRGDFCQYLWAKHFPGSNYNDQRGFVFVPFADSVYNAMAHGKRDGGCMEFNSQRDTLELTPGTSFPATSYDCCVIAMMYKVAYMRGGEVTIENA